MCATVYSSIENLLSHSSNVVCLLSHTQATSVDNLARCKHFTVTKPNFHSTFTKNLKAQEQERKYQGLMLTYSSHTPFLHRTLGSGSMSVTTTIELYGTF